MIAPTSPIIPPAPKVHVKDLPEWRLLLEFIRNPISILPDHAFDALISRRRVFGLDFMLLSDLDGVRHVLTTATEKYRRFVSARRVLAPLVGDKGLFLAAGTQWRRQRRMLAPVFTPENVGALVPHFMAAAMSLTDSLNGSRCANLSLAFQEATLEAVLRALFSLPHTESRGRIAAMVRHYLSGPGRPNILDGLARTEQSFAFATRMRRSFRRSWSDTIDNIVASRQNSPPSAPHRDLLSLLIAARDSESGEALSDVEVRDQCATMLLAGYETTSRLLFWTTYLVTLDTAAQNRLRDEFAAHPPERVSTLADLLNWPRSYQTLLESLRLYPPIPHVARESIADDVVAGEPVRPKMKVWISPWVIHRHRKFWHHPTAFMPDRFAGKAPLWTNDGAFLPFGAGPRICIGATFAMAEAQIMLATLLSRFKIALDDARPVLPVAKVTTAPSHEPLFRLERV